ncbi:Scr1 family TA system antitoxin-like transcriptional regulator [Lentzea sp. HUAS TT2]|uniref:Scr1 family TA system antitoxin-like transcriptional regulator n=1 Tax=Lentzea sp. HUAS TT2 TaxID=3447454 RepID=UPI003F6F5B01
MSRHAHLAEGYIRAIHGEQPGADGLTVEDRVQARRQDTSEKDNPPDVHMVLSESCLRSEWADPAVMRDQMEYLVELSQRPNLMIQVAVQSPCWPPNRSWNVVHPRPGSVTRCSRPSGVGLHRERKSDPISG